MPWPGIKLVSPALEGGFLTTETPGKSPGLSVLRSVDHLNSTVLSNIS